MVGRGKQAYEEGAGYMERARGGLWRKGRQARECVGDGGGA